MFPKKNIHIIIVDEIKINPKKILKNLYSFLDVNENFVPKSIDKKINISNVNLKAPNKIWSYINRTLVHNQRYVGGVNYGNKIKITEFYLRVILRVFARLIFLINELIDFFPKKLKKEEILSLKDKKEIYEKYFKSDIEKTETFLGIDLKQWKIF